MIELKTSLNSQIKHNVEIVFDNARTHTVKTVNINEFGLKFKF